MDKMNREKQTKTDKMAEMRCLRMTKTATMLILCLLAFCVGHTARAQRPRVGVVLSGGGAKGMAHIGALKVIEEAGIPIDIITGTSMGSIVGGLYAIGYSPRQLDSLVMAQDWVTLLSDKKPKVSLNLHDKEQDSRYILSVPFFEKPQDLISGGVVRGRNIGQMLWDLTEGYHDSIDFRHLPIPFACVAQDLVSGREVVFNRGFLPVAIRSSMSIPGFFAPVQHHGQLLIDGGIVNNYPVDVARRMGADIVIGVDVQDSMKRADELQGSIFAQLSQLIDLQGQERWRDNIARSDVYIKVDVSGYNTASFNTVAIDTLIGRGEQAARRHFAALDTVAQRVGRIAPRRETTFPPVIMGHYRQSPESHPALLTLVGKEPNNSVGLGLRFDNEELAALLLGAQVKLGQRLQHSIAVTLRLGMRTLGEAFYALHLGRSWNLAVGYRFTYNDFSIYSRGHKSYSISFTHHRPSLAFVKSWRNNRLLLGTDYQLYHYGSLLNRPGDFSVANVSRESYLRAGARYDFSSIDHPYFPTRGSAFGATYTYVMPLHHGLDAFHQAALDYRVAFSPNRRFTLLCTAQGRYISASSLVAELNALGGQERGKYLPQQLPFYGINHFEFTRSALVTAGVEARQRMGARHYVRAALNLAATSQGWSGFLSHSFRSSSDGQGFYVLGGAVGYDLRTFIGPIGATLEYSNRARFSGYIRAGLDF